LNNVKIIVRGDIEKPPLTHPATVLTKNYNKALMFLENYIIL